MLFRCVVLTFLWFLLTGIGSLCLGFDVTPDTPESQIENALTKLELGRARSCGPSRGAAKTRTMTVGKLKDNGTYEEYVKQVVVHQQFGASSEGAHLQDEASAADECTLNMMLHFDVDSAVLRPSGKRLLDKVGNVLVKPDFSGRSFSLVGHTDCTGTSAYNRRLSAQRALAAKEYLIARFHIDQNHLQTLGYGEEMPRADNRTPEGRQLNRRVEIQPAQ